MNRSTAPDLFRACSGYVRIEVEDLGGPWHPGQPDSRPHGLDIITALTGPDGWGVDTTSQGNRIVWALLDQPVPCGVPGVPDVI